MVLIDRDLILQHHLIVSNMAKVYLYVVDRDFGFAPNPYHGICTLATCKPTIRRVCSIGDWILGMGGFRLNATGHCIFAMQVSEMLTFNQYWENPLFNDKKPVRNGSKRMVVGDNIYYFNNNTNKWNQADSHHSNPDGTINESNLQNDTQTDRVLISKRFYYFGNLAVQIPKRILNKIQYKNGIGHRVYPFEKCSDLITWIEYNFQDSLNKVMSKPFDFDKSNARYSVGNNKITH